MQKTMKEIMQELQYDLEREKDSEKQAILVEEYANRIKEFRMLTYWSKSDNSISDQYDFFIKNWEFFYRKLGFIDE